MRRRRLPVVLMMLGVLAMLVWYVGYTQHVVTQLRTAASSQGRMYSRLYRALLDTSSAMQNREELLFELIGEVNASGLPLILTDKDGHVSAVANLPFQEPIDGPRTRAYVAELDRQNPPIVVPGVQGLHYGDSPIVRGLRVIPVMQAVGIGLLLAFALYALVERGRAEREKVWAGMAREAAHQLGTPLSALAGWLELLRDEVDTSTGTRAVAAIGPSS